MPASGVPVSAAVVPPGPAREPLYRRRMTWLAVAAVLAVLAVAGGFVLYLRGPAELTFVDLAEIARVDIGDESPRFTDAYVAGDRTYLAWQNGERLQVAAVDTDDGAQRWRQEISGRAEGWGGIRAYPDVVLISTFDAVTSAPRTLYGLDPASGREMWKRVIYGDDTIYGYDQVVVIADNRADALLGLDPRTGALKWPRRDNPRDSGGTGTAEVYPVRTAADLASPASPGGGLYTPVVDDDYRIVQMGADEAARVIDVRTGTVVRQRGNVGDSYASYLAYGDRLFVGGFGGGYEIVSYDLNKMGDPVVVYRAADEERSLTDMQPCGDKRLCVLETVGTGSEATTELVALDAAGGGLVWREPAKGGERLVTVGDRILVQSGGAEEAWVLRDPDGDQVISRQGRAVRVDDGNLLSFVGTFSSYATDVTVAGVGALSGTDTELGPLRGIRGESCSWGGGVIACATDGEFVLWRFAEV